MLNNATRASASDLEDFDKDMSSIGRVYGQDKSLEALQISEKVWNYGSNFETVPLSQWQQHHHFEIHGDNGSPAFLAPKELKNALDAKISEEKLIEYANPKLSDAQLAKVGKYMHHIEVTNDKIVFIDSVSQKDKYKEFISKQNSTETKTKVKTQQVAYTAQFADGSTRLFHYALGELIKNPGDVVIMPTPTYGLFIKPIIEHGARIVELPLKQQNDYKPDPQEIKTQIEALNKAFKEKHIAQVAWLQGKLKKLKTKEFSLDQKSKLKDLMNLVGNLSGALKREITNIDELQKIRVQINSVVSEFAESFSKDAALYNKFIRFELKPLNCVRAFLNVNPTMPLGKILIQDEINELANVFSQFPELSIIDDITYYDNILPPFDKKAGTFAKTHCAAQTVTLYSLSKQFGLASLRAACAIGPNEIIQGMQDRAFHECPSKNLYMEAGLNALFNTDPKVLTKHLEETNTDYALRRDFMIALVQGVKEIVFPGNKAKIEKFLDQNGVKSKKDKDNLLKGIPGLDLLSIPDSGFFVALNLEKFKGKTIGNTQLNTSLDFYLAFHHLLGISTIPMEMCFDTKLCALRFSYAISPQDMIESACRIQNLLANLKPTLKSKEREAAQSQRLVVPAQETVAKGAARNTNRQKEHDGVEIQSAKPVTIQFDSLRRSKRKRKVKIKSDDNFASSKRITRF